MSAEMVADLYIVRSILVIAVVSVILGTFSMALMRKPKTRQEWKDGISIVVFFVSVGVIIMVLAFAFADTQASLYAPVGSP